ncbi:MAG: tetratricopeptide repeat protein [Acidobacteria bacterium]|nr:tetratricopeptide repeat protein [Acidobacteriota bacterium]
MCYIPSLGGPYVYDDVTEIQTNSRAHRLDEIPSLLTTEFWYGERGKGILYRPVTAATIPVLFSAGDGSPWPFHAANLLLHALTTCFLAAAIFRLTGRRVTAMATGLLFALHPIHTEAVAWISGRSELLFASAGAAAWLWHLRAREGSRGGAILALVFLALSLGSKETAVAWLPIFFAADYFFPPPRAEGGPEAGGPAFPRGRTLRLHAGYALLVLAWIAARYLVLGQLGRRPEEGAHFLNPLEGEPWWPAAPFTSLRALAFALELLVHPAGGCIDYGYRQIPLATGLAHLDVALAIAAVAAAAVWVVLAARRADSGAGARVVALALVIFAAAWIPVSNLLIPSVSILAERNLYLPSLAVCLLAALLFEEASARLPRGRTPLLSMGVLIVAAGGASTIARARVFLDAAALFRNNTEVCGESARGHFLYGAALMDRGLPREAAESYARAVAIAPAYVDARADLAQAEARLGRADRAKEAARAAAALPSRSIESRLAVASALAAAGLGDESGRLMETIRAESPEDQRVLFIDAQLARGAGRSAEALSLFDRIRSLYPGSPVGADGRGAVLLDLGDHASARASFDAALTLDPYDANALYNLGWLALGTAHSGGGGWDDPVRWFRAYLRIEPENALGWMRLGEALEGGGRIAEAGEAFRAGVAAVPGHAAPAKALADFLARHP